MDRLEATIADCFQTTGDFLQERPLHVGAQQSECEDLENPMLTIPAAKITMENPLEMRHYPLGTYDLRPMILQSYPIAGKNDAAALFTIVLAEAKTSWIKNAHPLVSFPFMLHRSRGYAVTDTCYKEKVRYKCLNCSDNVPKSATEAIKELCGGRIQHITKINSLHVSNYSTADEDDITDLYFSFGNLEDRLLCKDNTRPLSVRSRFWIAANICRALIYLHHSVDGAVVHGDLKPENVLLEPEFRCRLSEAGVGRLCRESAGNTIFFEELFPNGTFAYIDPEYMLTSELTPSSDIYSFGVIILRILTGRFPVGLVNDVEEALERGSLNMMLDTSAGEWPKEVEQLVKVAIRCCEILGENRPGLDEIWNVLEYVENASHPAISSYPNLSTFLSSICISKDITPPSYFMCPILQDVMSDPVIAADGYTYERKAIKMWLDDGHTTSPMTNLKLGNTDLIPNHALRSAIKEWIIQMNDMSKIQFMPLLNHQKENIIVVASE